MRKRFFSIITGIAIMLVSTSQLRAQQFNSVSPNRLLPVSEFRFSSTQPQPGEKLRSDILKLVADSKEGRIAPQQLPAPKVHSLSKTAKIAIIAGVVVLVVTTIVVVHGVKNLHCESRCVL